MLSEVKQSIKKREDPEKRGTRMGSEANWNKERKRKGSLQEKGVITEVKELCKFLYLFLVSFVKIKQSLKD